MFRGKLLAVQFHIEPEAKSLKEIANALSMDISTHDDRIRSVTQSGESQPNSYQFWNNVYWRTEKAIQQSTDTGQKSWLKDHPVK